MSDVPQGPGWWQASDGRWYPPAQFPAGPPAGFGHPMPGMGPRTEPMAVISLVLGLISFPASCLCGVGLLTAIAAIVLGFLSRSKIRESPETYSGEGLALAGAIIGGVVILIFLLYVAFWGLAIFSVGGASSGLE